MHRETFFPLPKLEVVIEFRGFHAPDLFSVIGADSHLVSSCGCSYFSPFDPTQKPFSVSDSHLDGILSPDLAGPILFVLDFIPNGNPAATSAIPGRAFIRSLPAYIASRICLTDCR